MKEIFIAARKLIEKPEHWIKYRYAARADNSQCNLSHESAAKFCAHGALYKVMKLDFTDEPNVIRNACDHGLTTDFNDVSTHEMVLEKFDEVIADLTIQENEATNNPPEESQGTNPPA